MSLSSSQVTQGLIFFFASYNCLSRWLMDLSMRMKSLAVELKLASLIPLRALSTMLLMSEELAVKIFLIPW